LPPLVTQMHNLGLKFYARLGEGLSEIERAREVELCLA
jgi:hypothetical protein